MEIRLINVIGKYGIYATVLKHSISPAGINLITMEISYPRIVLAEANTHRMLCKNSSSSRAIPFEKMQAQLVGRPVRFGEANKGMQDKGKEFDAKVRIVFDSSLGFEDVSPEDAWDAAKQSALRYSEAFFKAGYHKQIVNRLTEPFQMMKTVVTWTEGANFFWLRNHEAADPSLAELARVMYEAALRSTPEKLKPGEWHLPYVDVERTEDGKLIYLIDVEDEASGHQRILTLEEALKVSCARTAAVRFRNVDYGVEKSEEVFNRLVGDERIHGSATEHQATPMKKGLAEAPIDSSTWVNIPNYPESWEEGITHMTRDRQLWSGPLRGWIQKRKLISNENREGFL